MKFEGNLFAHYADDTTPCTVGDNTTEVNIELTSKTQKVFTWLSDNQTNANHSKCNLLSTTSEPSSIQIGGAIINSLQSENLPENQ